MTKAAPTPEPFFGTLPDTLPLFPLPGVLVLPHGCLPLHVFEPRYRSMIAHAMKGNKLIGMVQTTDSYDEAVPSDANLFDVGCAARISSYNETDDGRMLISVCGVNRFRIIDDTISEDGYRVARVSYEGFEKDNRQMTPAEAEAERHALMRAIDDYFDVAEDGADWAAIARANTVDLLTSLAMMSPLDARDKQALLECPTADERHKLLLALMDMAATRDGPASSSTQ